MCWLVWGRGEGNGLHTRHSTPFLSLSLSPLPPPPGGVFLFEKKKKLHLCDDERAHQSSTSSKIPQVLYIPVNIAGHEDSNSKVGGHRDKYENIQESTPRTYFFFSNFRSWGLLGSNSSTIWGEGGERKTIPKKKLSNFFFFTNILCTGWLWSLTIVAQTM